MCIRDRSDRDEKISGLFGLHPLPDFLFNTQYSDVDKVYAFNRVMKDVSMQEKPDVILLGIPDSLLPLNLSLIHIFI